MSRRKRGRAVHGWLLLDKPAGMSSAKAVAITRRVLDARKAGHAGTLDPDATGVLAIAFGEATKTVPFVMDGRKTYRFEVRWGISTTTDDAAGEVIETRAARPSKDEIHALLPQFRGNIEQVPPKVSAIKIDGKRAYALTRAGADPQLVPRPIHVSRLDLIDCPDTHSAVFEMECGKGGYVRSIARDLGTALGCLGHVTTLRRCHSSPFDEKDCVSLDSIEAAITAEDAETYLLPITAALPDLPVLELDDAAARKVRHGNPSEITTPCEGLALACFAGQPLAIGTLAAGQFRPERVFVFETSDETQ